MFINVYQTSSVTFVGRILVRCRFVSSVTTSAFQREPAMSVHSYQDTTKDVTLLPPPLYVMQTLQEWELRMLLLERLRNV